MPLSLADAMFWLGVATCAVAQVAIVRSVIRARRAPDAPGTQDRAVPRSHFAVELAWAIVPALALALLFVATWRAMHP